MMNQHSKNSMEKIEIVYNRSTLCTTLVQDLDSGGSCECRGTGSLWELYVLSAQLCCGNKPALKNKVYWRAWLAQSGKHATVELGVMTSSRHVGWA